MEFLFTLVFNLFFSVLGAAIRWVLNLGRIPFGVFLNGNDNYNIFIAVLAFVLLLLVVSVIAVAPDSLITS